MPSVGSPTVGDRVVREARPMAHFLVFAHHQPVGSVIQIRSEQTGTPE